MSTDITTKQRKGGNRRGFGALQRFGKSLMLPIALLPAAGLLLRLGQDDLLGKIDAPIIGPFFDAMTASGDALFANLGFLFALGLAIGMAKKADATIGLSAVAGYLVMQATLKAMSPVVLAGQLDAERGARERRPLQVGLAQHREHGVQGALALGGERLVGHVVGQHVRAGVGEAAGGAAGGAVGRGGHVSQGGRRGRRTTLRARRR